MIKSDRLSTVSIGDFKSPISLDVLNLAYEPKSHIVQDIQQYVKKQIPGLTEKVIVKRSASLTNVSFRANCGYLTALLGSDEAELRTITDLIGERRKHGIVDGDIIMNGIRDTSKPLINCTGADNSKYLSNIAFVPHKSLYIVGLTYFQMCMYSAKLRSENKNTVLNDRATHKLERDVADADYALEKRVNTVFELMELTKLKNRVIESHPSLRGELGGDLRRLSIAMEIIALPPVIICDDPLIDMGTRESVRVLRCLRRLARRGHAVICSMPKPPTAPVFAEVDCAVVISNGMSIYAGDVANIETYFCSKEIGYKYDPTKADSADFLADIASGTERPCTQREAYTAEQLHFLMEKSEYYNRPFSGRPGEYLVANNEATLKYLGYLNGYTMLENLQHLFTTTVRAFHVKLGETEINKKAVMAPIVMGLYMGLFMQDNGNLGKYCTMMFGIPYGKTANLAGLVFFTTAFCVAQPILNVHAVCQKLQIFRYEQRSKTVPMFAFGLSLLVAELVPVFFYTLIYSNIVYFLVQLNVGVQNWLYFNAVCVLAHAYGFTLIAFLAATFKKEIMVRDSFFLVMYVFILLSGFLFLGPGMANGTYQITEVNALKWILEALMVFKFENYEDGESFLDIYGFSNFEKDNIFLILFRFIMVNIVLFFIALTPEPNFLSKKVEETDNQRNERYLSTASANESSIHKGFDQDELDCISQRGSSIKSTPIAPILFTKVSSISGEVRNSFHMASQTGELGGKHQMGPNVRMENITYTVGHLKNRVTVLENVCGDFQYGKLSMIIGALGSGKSTLLRVLAGDTTNDGTLSGNLLFNRVRVDQSLHPWQRCALVEERDHHFRDLSVEEVLTYAMKLRSVTKLEGNSKQIVSENVEQTLENMKLMSCRKTKTKKLQPGQLRRLSIGEEIVHGPGLLLLDEPTVGLDVREVSTTLMTFRDMVNQDKTVIATMHQPSQEAFNVFDVVMLMSKGHVIFQGPVEEAEKFFVTSPFQFPIEEYENTAEYLFDISAGMVTDCNNNVIGANELAGYFESTKLYNGRTSLMLSEDGIDKSHLVDPVYNGVTESGTLTSNPMSMDSEGDMGHAVVNKNAYVTQFHILTISDYITSLRNEDWETYWWKTYVLLERAYVSLKNRVELQFTSFLLFIGMGLFMSIVIGDTSRDMSFYLYNTLGFFCMTLLSLVLNNCQLIFYWYSTYEVFFKEHSRGLYSNMQQWLTSGPPIYFLRLLNTLSYIVIVYYVVSLRKDPDIVWFYVVMMCVAIQTGVYMCEAICVSVSPSMRAGYGAIPGVCFLQFAFSGMLVKAPSLPVWATWMPMFSFFKWAAQGFTLNEFNGTSLSETYIPQFYFSPYESFLATLGWNHQRIWHCFQIVCFNLVIYRVLTFISLARRTTLQKGCRQLRPSEEKRTV